jgi:hypothetical protein
MWDELVKGGIGAESNGDSMHKEKDGKATYSN